MEYFILEVTKTELRILLSADHILIANTKEILLHMNVEGLKHFEIIIHEVSHNVI